MWVSKLHVNIVQKISHLFILNHADLCSHNLFHCNTMHIFFPPSYFLYYILFCCYFPCGIVSNHTKWNFLGKLMIKWCSLKGLLGFGRWGFGGSGVLMFFSFILHVYSDPERLLLYLLLRQIGTCTKFSLDYVFFYPPHKHLKIT